MLAICSAVRLIIGMNVRNRSDSWTPNFLRIVLRLLKQRKTVQLSFWEILVSFHRAYFINGPNAAASIAPTLIRPCIIGPKSYQIRRNNTK